MTTFPSLIPSTRTFTPGIYPHTVFAGMSGKSNRVRNSNAMLQSQLRLSFQAITEAEMLSILAHYNGQQGSFLSFPLPSAVWSGGTASDFELSGYGWIYREPPTVEDLMCGGHNVELTLETVPPEGTALVGLNLTMRMLLSAGTVATAPGSLLSMTYGLDAGLVGAPGINGTIGYSLIAGTVDSESTDPDFASVSLLLHFDEDFTDSSTNALTVTANGNAQISTAESKFGGASGLFDGNGDYLSLGTTMPTALQIGGGDFTVEAWVYLTATSTQSLIGNLDDISGAGSWWMIFNSTFTGLHTVQFCGTSSQVFKFGTSTLATNQWVHVAVSRQETSIRCFVDGTQLGSTQTCSNFTGSYSIPTLIGMSYHTSLGYTRYPLTGSVDDLRVTKVARYASNFTPPTAPFPDS